MPARMTLRERATTALEGRMPDQIPFTCYSNMLPDGAEGRRLQELGLTAFARIPPYKIRRQRVEVETREITGDRYPEVITVFRTPVGTLTRRQIVEPGYGSLWTSEHLIKGPEDYRVFEFILRDEIYEPDIDGFLARDAEFGDFGLAVPRAADPPMQELWRRNSGLERFVLDWYDCPEEVNRVLAAMAERNKTIWKIVADTPSQFCSSGGNISGDTVGPPLFNELIMPHFEAEAEFMHPAGKRTLNHMDGMMKALVDTVARCPIDIVEAFNPTPDGNVSVGEAREAWPDKALSINFPSSMHLTGQEKIKGMTLELLRQAAPLAGGAGFVVGITEDVPADVLIDSFVTIAQTLNESGRCPLDPGSLPG